MAHYPIPPTLPSANYVREALSYNPQSGILRWRHRTDQPQWVNAKFAGKIAGYLDKEGYLKVVINGGDYIAHRVVWYMMTGEWPRLEIDHINGIKTDNRWGNIRLATRHQNAWNTGRLKNNTSGFKGVYRGRTKWIAAIGVNGRHHYLGVFHTPEEAHKAYVEAAVRLRGEFARTN